MSYYIVFSVLSIVFYSIVYLPQILLIYKNKSSCGISFLMLYVWTQADVLSLLAAIFSRLSLNVILLGWYDVATGIFMISFCFYYYPSKSKSFQTLLSILLFTLSNFTLLVIAHTLTSQQLAGEVHTLQLAGEVIGWLTTFLYLIGRFPQIYINFKSKNVDGLSILMFIYTILGNICYLLSIVSLSTEQSYIESNLPWITTTVVSILLDILVICQIKYYHHRAKVIKNTLIL
jgi:solute carrier family 66 (lysosomal lysine-arginine transporter), member 1